MGINDIYYENVWCVFFTFTDRASTIPNNIRGCQSGVWSSGQKEIRGVFTKLHREHKNKNKSKINKRKEIKTKHTRNNIKKDIAHMQRYVSQSTKKVFQAQQETACYYK